MKKKWLALALSAAMVTGLAACGGGSSAPAPAAEPAGTDSTVATAEPAGDEGSVLNVQVWNEEFISRVTDHYPGYEKIDATTGKIGDVTVKFTITATKDNAYQNNLDALLPGNADAAADDKVDLFLVEADYALKYVDADVDVAMPLSELGITDADLEQQYQYTKDVVTDANGELRGASWQACSAGLIYNRKLAQEVLGVSEPEEVQEFVKDWDAFNETAAKMKEKGYNITSTVNDTYRVYSNNVSAPWVVDGKVAIDPNIEKWVEDSKALVDAGETTTNDLWSDDWSKGFFEETPVFCYFGPAWLINFSMHSDEDGSVGKAGGWALTTGPQGYYWGGTWICAARGTDNPTLVKDIILTMTTDEAVLEDIAVKDSDCVNNKEVLAKLSGDESFGNDILGGQNPYAMLAEGAELVDMSNISIYDQGCNEEFQRAMRNYFEGNATYDEALAQFNTAVAEKYPELG